MNDKTQRRLSIAINLIIAIITSLLVYFFFSKVIGFVLPFIFALLIAYLIEPVVTFFEVKLKFKRLLASIVTIVLTLSILFSFLTIIIYELIIQIAKLVQDDVLRR